MNKLKMQTQDGIAANIDKIAALFPNCITETRGEDGTLRRAIDFEALQQELMPTLVSDTEERYQFTWPDKRKAKLLANAPINATLRPCREESVDFDNTHNLYIEGDNLDVLKCLKETYSGKIKMIYIDPPYNTGNDFVYNDDFAESAEEYLANSGQYDEQGNRLVTNTESNGRYHTDWLNMIYPRLKIARDLLTEDGVIFISIDNNEVENLRKICDEVFGESNCLGQISTINNLKGRSDDEFFATCNEFLLVYAKNKLAAKVGGFEIDEEEIEKDYDKQDEISYYKLIGFRKTGNGWRREDRPFMFYPVLEKDGIFSTLPEVELKSLYDITTINFNDVSLNQLADKYSKLGFNFILPTTEDGQYGRWRWGLDTFMIQKDINLELNNSGTLCTKMRATIEDGSVRVKTAKTVWYKPEYDTGSSARLIKELFGKSDMFDNPKSLVYLKDMVKIITDKDSIILDFFSGSATTAHAVMQLNAEDGGNRKFIMVQLPELTDEKSEAYKAGYRNICEIGKERIRRAGKKIKEESPLTTQDLDTGFRVLKLDSSNMEDVYYAPQDLSQANLFNQVDNVKEGRTPEDLLFQVMLELGVPLDSKIETTNIDGKEVFNVADNFLIACFATGVTDSVITAIAKQQPQYAALRDSSYADDSTATNFEQIFKTYSPNTTIKTL